jgi:hypothetical protein
LLPLIAKEMSRSTLVFAESVTTNSGVYEPWPPISVLLTLPVDELSNIPSGNGGKPEFRFKEKV